MRLRTLAPRVQMISGRTIQSATVERRRGSAGVKDRERIRERDNRLCQECRRQGRQRLGTAVDHIIPLWMGGSDEDENKELLCKTCHDTKTAREAAMRGG